MFSLRIVSTDHYLAEPIPELDMVYSEFRSSKIYKVPVIRLYGPTKLGQKTCMHVHGVFPYLYVPYDGSQPLLQYIQQFAISLDKAVNIALGSANSSRQHVYKISVVSGIPFYGYHSDEQSFLKIYLYNARLVQKVADLLLGGAIMNQVFQPHETHIPYTLQMFIDYNLFGMNFIDVGAVKFRYPLPEGVPDYDLSSNLSSSEPHLSVWTSNTVMRDQLLNFDVKRLSSCELEVDVVAADIINRLQIEDNLGSNPGLCALWEDERRRRADRHLPPDLEPPGSPDRDYRGTAAEDDMLTRLHQVVVSLQQYMTSQTSGSNTLFGSFPSSREDQEATFHLEQSLGSSTDTLHPLVDEDSVRKIISASQQSRDNQSLTASQLLDSSQDQSLVNLLASLAADASQNVVATLADNDSVISQVLPSSAEVLHDMEMESLEMSQRVWNTPEADNHGVIADLDFNPPIWDELENPVATENEEQPAIDLQGMDQSWNSSQWVSLRDVVRDDNDCIDLPQLDGLVDVKDSDCDRRVTRRRYGRVLPQQAVDSKARMRVSLNDRPESSGTMQLANVNETGLLKTSLSRLVSGLRTCSTSEAMSPSDGPSNAQLIDREENEKHCQKLVGSASREKIEACKESLVGGSEGSCKRTSKRASNKNTFVKKLAKSGRFAKQKVDNPSCTGEDVAYMSNCFVSLERFDLKWQKETDHVATDTHRQTCSKLAADQEHKRPMLAEGSSKKERSKLSLSFHKCKRSKTTQCPDVLHDKTEKDIVQGVNLCSEVMEISDCVSLESSSAVDSQASFLCTNDSSKLHDFTTNLRSATANIEHDNVLANVPFSVQCSKKHRMFNSRLQLKQAKVVLENISLQVSEQRSQETSCSDQVPELSSNVERSLPSVDSMCSKESISSNCSSVHCDPVNENTSSSLSIDHEWSPSVFCRHVKDLDCTDVMYHMSLMSSPDSSDYDASPPVPFSPSYFEQKNCMGFDSDNCSDIFTEDVVGTGLQLAGSQNSEAEIISDDHVCVKMQMGVENEGEQYIECQNEAAINISDDFVHARMQAGVGSEVEQYMKCQNNEKQTLVDDAVCTIMQINDGSSDKQYHGCLQNQSDDSFTGDPFSASNTSVICESPGKESSAITSTLKSTVFVRILSESDDKVSRCVPDSIDGQLQASVANISMIANADESVSRSVVLHFASEVSISKADVNEDTPLENWGRDNGGKKAFTLVKYGRKDVVSDERNVWHPVNCPPSHGSVLIDLASRQHLVQSTLDAYCSNPLDMPANPRDGMETNTAVRSPLISELSEHISTFSRDCGIVHWQSISLSLNRLVGSSQSQFNAHNVVSCPALLASTLASDPTIVLVPLLAPPEPHSVCEWVRQVHVTNRLPPSPVKNQGDLKKLLVNVELLEDAAEKEPISSRKSKRPKKADNLSSTLVSDRACSLDEGKVFEIIDQCQIDIPPLSSNGEINVAAHEGLSAMSSALSGRVDIVTSSKDIAWSDEMESNKRRGSLESSTSSVMLCLDEVHGHTKVLVQDGAPSESTSEGIRMSGNIAGSGSDSTLLTSQMSFSRTNISKASRVELELPQTYTTQNTTDNFRKKVLKEQEESADVQPASHLSFRGTECDAPMASTPYSRRRDNSVVGQMLAESPIDCIQNTPRRSSIETETSRNPRAKCALRLTTKPDVPAVKNSVKQSASEETSQICGPTPKNPFGFKLPSQNIEKAKAVHEYQYITVLSIELHIATRSDLLPDPEFDEIRAVFYSIHTDTPPNSAHNRDCFSHTTTPANVSCPLRSTDSRERSTTDGIIMVMISNDEEFLHKTGLSSCNVIYVESELQLIAEVVSLVKRCDADMLVGYEIQQSSWGYLVQRAARFDLNLQLQLSRVTEFNGVVADGVKEYQCERNDKDDLEDISDLRIVGRVVLNLWRVIRHEVTLNIYTFENVAYHVLHIRLPWYSERDLSMWYDHKTHLFRWRTVKYYSLRARANLQLIEKLDLIGQTSEFARVFGIEFYHVLSRGTQYRVESMMLRLVKPLNFVAVSPGVQQRARMVSPECIPLNLEPWSQFYTHPVVVLDFQSLYPSIMIAYNYCYSTCLGRLDHLARANEGAFDFGCTSLNISPDLLKSLQSNVNICPNGVVFVKHHIRHGVLPRMVEEILNSRLMVKKAMKDYKNEPGLHKLLNARQLGLKLIANVTFGYTSANFSGRMPCVEIGDSIVRKSRETLERAIRLVENTRHWGARVVYGDTDSMFVLLQGRTKEEAFVIGQQIADAVTKDNPKPVKLKLEKVYLPCVLQTKKRYVGFMYESPDQKEPIYDAKGIETVRRDSCAAVSKILERSIKLLFTTRDVSQVKLFVQRQCTKLMMGSAGIQDFIFAKEYRGASGYQPGACVPALEIARRSVVKDRRSEPLVGQRVPYVIVYGMPGLPLIQLVRSPRELLADSNLRLNVTYYITKQILPPLARIFSLLGVDVSTWYTDLPRVLRSTGFGEQRDGSADGTKKKGTLLGYFSSLNCPVCDERSQCGLCADCKTDKQRVAVISSQRIHSAEQRRAQIDQICTSCMSYIDPSLPCASLDCPIYFRLFRVNQELTVVRQLEKLQIQLLNS